MRVNISHSVELSEVPQSVKNLLVNNFDIAKLEEQHQSVLDALSGELSVNSAAVCIEQMSLLRQKLFKSDSLLQDCTNILAGYIQALTPAGRPEADNAPAETSELPEAADE